MNKCMLEQIFTGYCLTFYSDASQESFASTPE